MWIGAVLAFHRAIRCPLVYCDGPRDRTIGTITWITSPRWISVAFNGTSGERLQRQLHCVHSECANYALDAPITVYYHHCYGATAAYGLRPEAGPSMWCVLAWGLLFTLLLIAYNAIAEHVIAPRLLFQAEEEEAGPIELDLM